MTLPPLEEYKRSVVQLMLVETDRMLYRMFPASGTYPAKFLKCPERAYNGRCKGCGCFSDLRTPGCHNCSCRHAMRAKSIRDRIRAHVVLGLAKPD